MAAYGVTPPGVGVSPNRTVRVYEVDTIHLAAYNLYEVAYVTNG